ncbi:hypothetical protein GCM10008019_28530 [Deinococcus soli (ex Cha et al. 2016)]|nr:hypothetical protein GCM10008019_28530 [Deinococcus soli (ex Cha et al. 2016)]
MKRSAFLILTLGMASCGVKNVAPEPTADTGESRQYLFDPSTGEIKSASGVGELGYNITSCLITIANAHMSSTVPGSVKVNGTATCPPSSEPYVLQLTTVLEKCNDSMGYVCYAYKTGTTTGKTVGSSGATWYNEHMNSFAQCYASAYFRGRVIIKAFKPDGVSIAVPLVEPVGYISWVQCP